MNLQIKTPSKSMIKKLKRHLQSSESKLFSEVQAIVLFRVMKCLFCPSLPEHKPLWLYQIALNRTKGAEESKMKPVD